MSYKIVYLARRAKSVSREDWPKTWKSHAVFASQFPALEAKIDWMRYCNRIDGIDLPGLSTAHDGVALVAGDSLEGLTGTGISAEDRAKIDADELRVFDMLTPNFTFYCEENVLRDGPAAQIAMIRFLPRAEGVSHGAFDARLYAAHADIGPLPGLNRLALNRPVQDPLPLFPFDGIAEWWFESEDDAVNAVAGEALGQDLADFCDMDRAVTMLTSICHRWPKD